jgi:signal transduction histidine kinase
MYKETLPEDIRIIIWAVAAIFVTLAAFIIFFILIFTRRKNKLIHDKMIMKGEFRHTLLQTQIEIQEQTLKTISQEIHDNIGQVLSLAKLNLSTFEHIGNAANQTKLNDTRQLVSKAIVDLRNLSRSMYGGQLNDLGLPQAISNELTLLQNTGQFKTAIEISGEPFRLTPQKEMIVFRIVQEAINNSIKHAAAKNISVKIKYHADTLSLSVADDGRGFDLQSLPASQSGMGLKSMQNRATLIGGAFAIDSTLQTGTTISFALAQANNKQ